MNDGASDTKRSSPEKCTLMGRKRKETHMGGAITQPGATPGPDFEIKGEDEASLINYTESIISTQHADNFGI